MSRRIGFIRRRGNSAEEDAGRVTFCEERARCTRNVVSLALLPARILHTHHGTVRILLQITHRVTARTVVRYQERRHRLIHRLREGANLVRIEEAKERRELQRWYVWSEQLRLARTHATEQRSSLSDLQTREA